MFEPEIKKVINKYISNRWYIKEYPIEQQKEELLARVKENIPLAYTLLYETIDRPNAYKEVYSYLEDFALLRKSIEFIKQEGITLDTFNLSLSTENSEKLSQEATRLLDTILAKEIEPYFKLIFEDIPAREHRANALFKEELLNETNKI